MQIIERTEAGAITLELRLSVAPGATEALSIEVWCEVDHAAGQSGEAAVEADEIRHAQIDPDQPTAMHRAWRQSSAVIDTRHLLAERALERANADLRLLLNTFPGEDGDEHRRALHRCRRALVQLPFRARLDHQQFAAADRAAAGRPVDAGRARAAAGDRRRRLPRRPAGQDPARAAHRRAGRTNEIPHTPYYGTVDATPMWLMLLDEYERWTGDEQTVDRLWPDALAALRWIDEFGDIDGDGFVEYGATRSAAW